MRSRCMEDHRILVGSDVTVVYDILRTAGIL
jgi:hypothetical protein